MKSNDAFDVGVEDVLDEYDAKQLKKLLKQSGISIQYLIKELKDVIDSTNDGRTKLAAVQQLLGLCGIYKKKKADDDDKDSGWEDVLMERIQEEKKKEKEISDKKLMQKILDGDDEEETGMYHVEVPALPESLQAKKDAEGSLNEDLIFKPNRILDK